MAKDDKHEAGKAGAQEDRAREDRTREDSEREVPLNPALKSGRDKTHDYGDRTPSPYESTSAKESRWEVWPFIWATIAIICVILAIYFLL